MPCGEIAEEGTCPDLVVERDIVVVEEVFGVDHSC